MSHSKAALRQSLKQARLAMTDEARRAASVAIAERLKQAADWSGVRALHYFEPLRQLKEPDIGPFITWLEDSYPQLQLSTSRLIGGRWEVVGTHGGPPPPTFDTIIVPMLGFDSKTRHRLGYGGGYYDKFLAAQPQAHKIGVSFAQGRVARLPAEPHDVPLDVIITES